MASNGNNGFLLFAAGVALGVGLGLYLQSEDGKKARKNAAGKWRDLESEIEEKVKEALEKLKQAN